MLQHRCHTCGQLPDTAGRCACPRAAMTATIPAMLFQLGTSHAAQEARQAMLNELWEPTEEMVQKGITELSKWEDHTKWYEKEHKAEYWPDYVKDISQAMLRTYAEQNGLKVPGEGETE